MEKRIPSHLSLISLLLLLSVSVTARNEANIVDHYHFGYVSVGGGYSSIVQDVPGTVITGDVALLGGLGYEFRHNSFWLSVGAQYTMERSRLKADNLKYDNIPGIDDMGKEVKFGYYYNQADQHNWRTIDIPLMVGYYYSGFYAGAGAKIAFSYGSFVKSSGTYRFTGTYTMSQGDHTNTITYGTEGYPVGYYKPYATENKTTCALRPQVSVIGEVGYDVLSSMLNNSLICHVLKVGFYFECGLNTFRPIDSLDPLNINPNNAAEATMNPYVLTAKTADQILSTFMVGAKLTYMIGGSRNNSGTWHKGCQCYGN